MFFRVKVLYFLVVRGFVPRDVQQVFSVCDSCSRLLHKIFVGPNSQKVILSRKKKLEKGENNMLLKFLSVKSNILGLYYWECVCECGIVCVCVVWCVCVCHMVCV